MPEKTDDFRISIGDDLLAEALEAVEKRLYKKGSPEKEAEEDGEIAIELEESELENLEIDLSELDLDLALGLEEEFEEEAAGAVVEQLKKALEQNAELQARARDAKDEVRRLATKLKRLSETNAQLKLDVRDGEENLKTWQEMVAEFKSAAKEHNSAQSSLRTKHKRALEEATHDGLARNLKALLTPIDHIEMSFKHLDHDIEKDTPLHGLKMSFTEFQKALKKIKLVKVDASPGLAFDPESHEAIARLAHPDFETNLIIEVHRSGYRFGKRLLRATQVTVSSGLDDSDRDGEE
jgi:molecular chaperone GrpE (heat shock protein)